MKLKESINSIVKFINESYIELKKVNWLTKKEVLASSVVVVILILIMSIYIGLVDFILSKILSIFIGGRV